MNLDDLITQSSPAQKTSPTVSTKSPVGTSSLDRLIASSKGTANPVSAKVQKYQADAQKSTQDAKDANSIGGLAKSTALGLPRAALGLPRAALDVGRDLLKGGAEFGMSAGEAIPRLLSPKLSTVVLPPANVPGLSKLTGPLQSFQSKAAQAVQNGSSVPGAVAKGTLDTVLNDPVGVAFKPVLLGAGALGRVLLKNQAAKDELAKLVEAASQMKSREVNSEFAGMTLPERLAATDNTPRKVSVTDENSVLRKIPVSGESTDRSIPFENKYTHPDELPTVNAGSVPKVKDGLPVIQTSAPKGKGEFTYHPIDSLIEKSKPQTPLKVPTKSVVTPKETPVTTPREVPVTASKPPVETPVVQRETPLGGPKTSGVAKDIQTKAIENGLISEYKDAATYDARNIKEQAQKIADIVTNDPKDLGRMVRGEIPVPKDISPSYLVTAADKYATENKDGKLLQDLISSKLTGEGSQHASELRMLGERDSSSAMKALKEVQAARETAATSRLKGKTVAKAKSDTVKAIKSEVKNVAPKKEDWHSFITNLTC